MRIATYNIWNTDKAISERKWTILTQIQKINADIICLQEVVNYNYYEYITQKCNYQFSCFFNHTNEEEGLAVLSKYPIRESKYISNAIITVIEVDRYLISLANVHLSWDSALKKEKEIINIVKNLDKIECDFSFIAGDFNCSPNSSVHRYLLGQQSLYNEESNPYWYDLAESYGDIKGIEPDVTIDFRTNPRWNGKNTIEVNQRCDCIFIRNPYPKDFPCLVCCDTFGKEIDFHTKLAASDHWGVLCDLDFI